MSLFKKLFGGGSGAGAAKSDPEPEDYNGFLIYPQPDKQSGGYRIGARIEKEIGGEEVHMRDMSGNRTLVVFGTGDEIVVQSGDEGVRFLLVSGAPIKEPVAWHGPIVMNTREELEQAFRDLRSGSFIRESATV